jgi:hypothetical protein
MLAHAANETGMVRAIDDTRAVITVELRFTPGFAVRRALPVQELHSCKLAG